MAVPAAPRSRGPSPRSTAVPRVLDARTLGRPVHLLPGFAAQLGERLADWFEVRLNRRYRAGFVLGETRVRHSDHVQQEPRMPAQWMVFGTETGRLGVALDRDLLRAIFGYRYGVVAAAAAPVPSAPQEPSPPRHEDTAEYPGTLPQRADAPDAADPPFSQTEERFSSGFGLLLAQLLAESIEAQARAGEARAVTATQAPAAQAGPSSVGGWAFHTELRDSVSGCRGALWLALDDAWMARLLHHLARPARARPVSRREPPTAHAVQLTLLARLVQREMPLGQLLGLRVGDVIPITLGPADVLVDDSRLFTAAVAEHKGKLCLTSFEDAE
ncbi:FliM/FliN family flagellar motor switch protein [Paracidovorax anthurii]|uniref:Flagellar motor switch protein FliM n=1 Tax=Paracidovorax anthurii TaxID=78229 RepID=A0A328YVK1_9BURK|nr:flagellar motor switch protein FliM [Paracidovorax anthurii]